MLVTFLRPSISKPGFRDHKVCRCVCVLSVGQMLQEYVVAKLADIIPFVANHQDLIRVCVLYALAAVCLEVSGTADGFSISQKKQLHKPGSPKITTELTAFNVSAGNSFAALCTSCPPWEYPLTTTFELGHELRALVTSEALFKLARLLFLVSVRLLEPSTTYISWLPSGSPPSR